MTHTGSREDSTEARPTLLLIEDDDGVRRGLQLLLHGQGFDVHAFASAQAALADPMAIYAPYLVIDYVLGQEDGISAAATLRERGWRGVAVLVTAFGSPAVRSAAASAGFAAVIDKPFRDDVLLRALRR